MNEQRCHERLHYFLTFADIITEMKNRRGLFIGLLILFLVAIFFLAMDARQIALQVVDAWHPESTVETYQQFVKEAKRAPWRTDLWELAGRRALEAGEYREAVLYLEQVEANKESLLFSKGVGLSPQGLIDLGDAYLGSGDLLSAISSWQKALSEAESSKDLNERIIKAHLVLGDYPAAIVALQRQAATPPQDPQVIYQLGLLTATQDPEAALETLSRAAELAPELEAPVSQLRRAILSARFAEDISYSLLTTGRALAALNKWALAGEAFQNATIARPDYAEAWAYLGEARQHLSEEAEARSSSSNEESDGLRELSRALALDSDSLAAHTFLALYWTRQGEYDRALESIQAAHKLEPRNPALIVELGSILAQSGDLKAAHDAYQQAISYSPYEPLYQRRLIDFSLRYNYKIDQIALPVARQLVIEAPEDAANLDSMAQALTAVNDLANAERFLERALQVNSNYAPAHLHLGFLYLLQGNTMAAEEEFELVLSLAPDDPIAEQAKRLKENLSKDLP